MVVFRQVGLDNSSVESGGVLTCLFPVGKLTWHSAYQTFSPMQTATKTAQRSGVE